MVDKIEYVLNWFRCKFSSGIPEGFNNKIKRLKRMAYGYKDIEYFKLKIHQHCGYLNPGRLQLNQERTKIIVVIAQGETSFVKSET